MQSYWEITSDSYFDYIKQYVEGIGPWKDTVVPVKDNYLQTPTDLVARAHSHNLQVLLLPKACLCDGGNIVINDSGLSWLRVFFLHCCCIVMLYMSAHFIFALKFPISDQSMWCSTRNKACVLTHCLNV
jgi:hypothetical protein